MNARINLNEMIDNMMMQSAECTAYFDRQTGQIEFVTSDGYGDPDEEELEFAQAVEDDTQGRFVPLPDTFEIHEWQMMEDFAKDVKREQTRQMLLDALHGKGAFRRFKDKVNQLGIEKNWYAFQNDCYRAVAIRWCEHNGIEYEQSD